MAIELLSVRMGAEPGGQGPSVGQGDGPPRAPATLPRHRAVWRHIIVEGPTVDDGAVRAAWVGPRLGVTPDEYERG